MLRTTAESLSVVESPTHVGALRLRLCKTHDPLTRRGVRRLPRESGERRHPMAPPILAREERPGLEPGSQASVRCRRRSTHQQGGVHA
jgi:hypothetical protein